jgi:Sensors of blue-light using FAD
MEAIATDRRHSGLRILREEPIPERRFENWSFGLFPAGGDVAAGDPERFILRLSQRS